MQGKRIGATIEHELRTWRYLQACRPPESFVFCDAPRNSVVQASLFPGTLSICGFDSDTNQHMRTERIPKQYTNHQLICAPEAGKDQDLDSMVLTSLVESEWLC